MVFLQPISDDSNQYPNIGDKCIKVEIDTNGDAKFYICEIDKNHEPAVIVKLEIYFIQDAIDIAQKLNYFIVFEEN